MKIDPKADRTSSTQDLTIPQKTESSPPPTGRAELLLIECNEDMCSPPVQLGALGIRKDMQMKPQKNIRFSRKPSSCLIIKKWRDDDVTQHALEVTRILKEQYGVAVFAEPTVVQELPGSQSIDLADPGALVDFAVVLGGDGTLLHFAALFDGSGVVPPVICFAEGSLGFLTPVLWKGRELVFSTIMNAHKAPLLITPRMRLQGKLYRDGSDQVEGEFLALNEMIVERGPESGLSALELHVDDKLLTIVQADGLIISTPTGSTAYSMSAGGPMMSPMTRAFVITPICPHTLSFRPLVLPDSCSITVVVPQSSRAEAAVRFDGRNANTLHRGDKVVIRASVSSIPTINMKVRQEEWFDSIVAQLHWNVRTAQKPTNNNS